MDPLDFERLPVHFPLINLHSGVYLPYKSTCTSVSKGTWEKNETVKGLSLNNDRGMQWPIQTFRKRGEGGGGGHPDPVIGGGVLKKKFPPFRLQFGLKIRGGVGPRAPSLHPSLVLETFGFEDEDEIRNKVFFTHHGILESLTLQFLFYFTGKVCTVIFIEGG